MPAARPRPFVVVALLCLLATLARAGTVHTVGQPVEWLAGQDAHQAGPHHASLAAALAAAEEGDTLLLLPGLHRGRHRLDKRLTLTGVASGQQAVVQGALEIRADGVVLQRLVFERVGSPAVLIEGAADVVVRDCRFERLPAALEVRGATGTLLLDNRFHLVTKPVRLVDGVDQRLSGNVIDGAGVAAVDVGGCSGLVVADNSFVDIGWTGLVLHSHSDGVQVIANRFEGGDMGLAAQTSDNRIEGNLFQGNRRGLLLGTTPFGMDGHSYDRTAFLDSDSGDAQVAVSGNRVLANTFRDCRREAALLRGAPGNTFEANDVGPSGRHGLVLMSASDGNRLEHNRFAPRDGAHVLLVDSAANSLTGNLPTGADGPLLGAELVDAPRDGADANHADGPLVTVAPAERAPATRPAPDGSGRLLVFGDFHTHSVLSDGSCQADDILRYGRDVLGLDFTALSDHGEVLSRQPDRWPQLNQACRQRSLPGRFVALPGYEVTFPVTWAGHWNVYFPHDRGGLHRAPYDDYEGLCDTSTFSPRRLIDALVAEQEEFVIIRHHFGPTADYWREAPVEPYHVPATEICSVHGIFSGERDSNRNRNHPMGHDQDHLGSVGGGLASGRVFGIVGSSDTHYGFPGDDGLAALMVDALTPEALVDAVRQRRSYATTGAPIVLGFRVDGASMGSVLAPASRHELDVHVEGTADLEELVLYRGEKPALVARSHPGVDGSVSWVDQDGRPLDGRPLVLGARSTADDGGPGQTPDPTPGTQPTTSSGATSRRGLALRWSDEQPSRPGTYWRVRVRQVDGELAWSTPVWVEPGAPELADAETLHDKEVMSLMVYAASLRAWPKLPLGVLDGRSPSEAMGDAEGAARVAALWPRLVQNAERINAQARELGLTSRAAAQRALDRFHARWGNDLPRTVLATEPVIDLDVLADQLGLDR